MIKKQYLKKSFLYLKLQKAFHIYLAKKSLFDSRNLRKVILPLLDEQILREKLFELDKIAENKKVKTYYIISRENSSIGLLTYVSLFLGHLAYAAAKGYMPVIDIKNTASLYLEESEIGKTNAWEFYYDQPYGTDLDEVFLNEKFIIGSTKTQPLSPFINSVFDEKESIFWKTLYQHFVKLNDKTQSYVDEEYNNLLFGKKTLGLLYRGTDYVNKKPHGHPKQPTLEEFALKIEEKINKWGEYDCYFLATESKEASDFLRERFPGKIVENKKVYYDLQDIDYLYQATFNRENDKYLKGLEYLSSIYLLSKCDAFIAGLCAGTYAANFMKRGDFENKYFFNLGVY